MMHPRVSVIMPVYNSEEYLSSAIESILNQSYKTLELIIVNDGSTDRSSKIVRSYSDRSIKFIDNNIHKGLPAARNDGILQAQGEYIACLDADDISHYLRLEKQVQYMDIHPEIGLCGTWAMTIGEMSSRAWQYPTDSEMLRCNLLFCDPFTVSSVIMRKKIVLDLLFDVGYRSAEDYDLWERLSRLTKTANIPEVLTFYRFHDKQMSWSSEGKREQKQTVEQIQRRQLKFMNIIPSQEEFDMHYKLGAGQFDISFDFCKEAERWLSRLSTRNRELGIYPEAVFCRYLAGLWFSVCNASSPLGIPIWFIYSRSFLAHYHEKNFKGKIIFFLKCCKRTLGK